MADAAQRGARLHRNDGAYDRTTNELMDKVDIWTDVIDTWHNSAVYPVQLAT